MKKATQRKTDPALVWEHLLSMPDKSQGSLAMQIVTGFIDAIDGRRIPEGVRVPSTRVLAQQLEVGRNTAIAAITTLIEQGYLVSKDRSGIFVTSNFPPVRREDIQDLNGEPFDWTSRLQLERTPPGPASIPLKSATCVHNFMYGQFDLTTFPTFHWRQCERSASGLSEIAQWGRDMFDRDDPELVETLRRHVLPNHGIWAEPDEILVTLGGQEGRYLVTRLLGKTGITIGVEDPGLPDISEMIGMTPARRIDLPIDGEGARISSEFKQCDVAFLMPGHHCPTTAVMSLERRQAVLNAAKRRDMVIVEDTYETELLSNGQAIPTLKSLDPEGRVIHIGSLSKAVAPGLRIGFVVAAPTVIGALRSLRRLVHRHPPGNVQRALAIFIDRGYYHSYIRRVSDTLSKRTAVFKDAFHRHLPHSRLRHCEGAASFWIELPISIDANELCLDMAARGVMIESGERFFQTKAAPHHLRMAISQIPENKIEAGIQLIAKAL